MANIVELKQTDGTKAYPATKAEAVYMGDGSTAETAISKREVLVVSCGTVSSLPITINNNSIEDDMVVIQSTITYPQVQLSDWTVTTANGSLTISGSISGSSTVTLYLMKSR